MDKPDLKDVLVHYVDFEDIIESIWIVDLKANTEIKSFTKKYQINYIELLEDNFNKSFAINVGIYEIKKRYTNREIDILICDSDVKIPYEVLLEFKANSAENIVLHEVVETEDYKSRIAFGIIKTTLSNLMLVDGYDSNFKGWGFEDHDIIFRIEAISQVFLRLGFGYHLSHSDIYRIKNYHSTDIQAMRLSNLAYYEEKKTKMFLMGTYKKDIKEYRNKYSSVS